MIYLNGQFTALEKAKISVLDRGFLFGDSVYEVIPVYAQKCFYLSAHLTRLKQSLSGVDIENPKTDQQWSDLFKQLIIQNDQASAQYIYLQISRGADSYRDHCAPKNITPTVFAMLNDIAPAKKDLAETGVKAITLDDDRWKFCNIKSTLLLPNILARTKAAQNDAIEAILIRDNIVVEGAASNIFMIQDGVIYTQPKSHQILAGITRDIVLNLAKERGTTVKEVVFSTGALFAADEVWMTSSTKEILPICMIDQQKINTGKPEKLWKIYQQKYKDKIQQFITENHDQ